MDGVEELDEDGEVNLPYILLYNIIKNGLGIGMDQHHQFV